MLLEGSVQQGSAGPADVLTARLNRLSRAQASPEGVRRVPWPLCQPSTEGQVRFTAPNCPSNPRKSPPDASLHCLWMEDETQPSA